MKKWILAYLMLALTAMAYAGEAQDYGAVPSDSGYQSRRVAASRPARNVPNWDGRPEVYPGTEQDPTPNAQQPSHGKQGLFASHSVTDSIGKSINPNDVDYGGLLAIWRLQIVHDTILKAEYWGIACETGLILLLLAYIYWLIDQREQRFRITVDIVHQLRNSRSYARFYANRVIRIHNELVRGLNDEYERKLRSGDEDAEVENAVVQYRSTLSERQIPDTTESQPAVELTMDESLHSDYRPGVPQIEAMKYGLDNDPAFTEQGRSRHVGRDKGTPTMSVTETLERANAAAAREESIPISVVADDPEAEKRRLQAQNEALQQKVRALRNQVNQQRQERASGLMAGEELEGQ